MESKCASKSDLPSNEEIIDDLTEDLEEKLVTDVPENGCRSKLAESRPNLSRSTEDDMNKIVEEATEDEMNKPVEDTTANDDQDSDIDIEEDEVALRERESTWTDEEKQKHKDESQRLKLEGNSLFSDTKYKEAAHIYIQALFSCPLSCTHERSVLYSNLAACRVRQEKKKQAIVYCTKALELNPIYLKALMRRAQLYRETEKLDEALADYQRVLEIDGNILEARQAVVTLPEEIKDRNEKLKVEMMGKLKDLGNVILRPFGLSTNNFKLTQDPNTGGYSINFQKNS